MESAGDMRSKLAQAKASQKGVKSKVKQGKALKSKTAKLDKPVVMHHLLFMGMAAISAAVFFIPVHQENMIFSIPKMIFGILGIFYILMGIWHINRLPRKVDWAEKDGVWPESLILLTVPLFMALVFILITLLVPGLLGKVYGNFTSFTWVFATSILLFFIPFIYQRIIYGAIAFQDKQYDLWFFPKDYREKQPTWNRDFVVFADLTFIRDIKEPFLTEVKVKLPQEANFGEMIYLFLQDYNNNRSPENPVKDLWSADGKMGWMFYVPGKLGMKKIINPDLTIAENKIKENSKVIFKRIWPEDE